MALPDVALSAVFAGMFVVAYVFWKFIGLHGTRNEGTGRPPTIWSLPLIASFWFLPDFTWHREFLRMSTKIGNVFSFYLGSRYVSCILLIQSAALCVGVCGSTISATRPVPVADDATSTRTRPAPKISTHTRPDPRVYPYP